MYKSSLIKSMSITDRSRETLLWTLSALDFMLVDIGLYLDTHPSDCEAIEKYNEILKKANAARCEYENQYGPLTSFRSAANYEFDWIDDPWPWQKDFN